MNLLYATAALNKKHRVTNSKDSHPLRYFLWKWIAYARGADLQSLDRDYTSAEETEVLFTSKDEADKAINMIMKNHGSAHPDIKELGLQLKNAINSDRS